MPFSTPHAQSSVRRQADPFSVVVGKDASLDVKELESLAAAIRTAAEGVVGRLSLNDALTLFRNTMVDVALVRGNGSRRAAAKLLRVTRPAVQYVLRRSERGGS